MKVVVLLVLLDVENLLCNKLQQELGEAKYEVYALTHLTTHAAGSPPPHAAGSPPHTRSGLSLHTIWRV
jgi:hypothetical protein